MNRPDPLLDLISSPVIIHPNDVAPLGPLPAREGTISTEDGLKYRAWHDSLIDYMLLNPTATYEMIGNAIGRTAASIGYVVRSDIFRARYAQRRNEHSKNVSDKIVDVSRNIATKSLQRIEEVLNDDVKMKNVSPGQLNEIAKTALTTIGLIDSKGAPSSATQINIHQHNVEARVTSEDLVAARQRIAAREQRKIASESDLDALASPQDTRQLVIDVDVSSEGAVNTTSDEGGGAN
jgi:hypothetical protein